MLNLNIEENFKKRRLELISDKKATCFIFIGNEEVIRNHDVGYPFRQCSDFYYLTGLEEPNSILLLLNCPDKGKKEILFIQESDPKKELWEGELYGLERAKETFNVDQTYNIDQFEETLTGLVESVDQIYFQLGKNSKYDKILFNTLSVNQRKNGRTGIGQPEIVDNTSLLGRMRLIKDNLEINLMKQSGKISSIAHKNIIKTILPGMNEHEVYAQLSYEFLKMGHKRLAYESIVAGGKNACCLHYTSNNEVLNEGDLLLIDAGGEFNYYASDITRTFPVGKKFSSIQAKVYKIVLDIQKSAIQMIKPGVSFKELNEFVDTEMAKGLISLNVFNKSIEEILKNKDHKKYYPHGLGHWLGLDVHDKGQYYTDRNATKHIEFSPGMVMTIEPGLYFPKDDQNIPAALRGIGIRIEDDILVTSKGFVNLTMDVPKEIDEIESLRENAYQN
jgi:Xaa-Pro aminopeptidase